MPEEPSPSTEPSIATTTSPTPGPDVASSGGLLAAACAGSLSVTASGTLDDSLTSVSGLAASAQHDGIVWAVEDSLEPATITALRTDGSTAGAASLRSGLLANLDWEALSFDHGAERPTLYVGDIGDNFGVRAQVRLFELDEPDPSSDSEVSPRRRIDLRYRAADGTAPRPNAEALVVHRGIAWVVDKRPGAPARVHRAELGSADPVLVETDQVDLPGEQVTGVDLSPDATVVALRTNRAVRLYPSVLDDQGRLDLPATLAGEPCDAPAPPEAQGEAISVLPGAQGIVTVGEDEDGAAVPMHVISTG